VSVPQGSKEHARDFTWSPDGSRLGFIAETEAAAKEGFEMDARGPGAAHKATGAAPAGGSVSTQIWGGKTLVFMMSDPLGGPSGTPGSRVSMVDTTALPPPSPVPLSDWNAEHSWITRDGMRVAYWERTGPSTGRMMTRKIGGATPTDAELMHPPLAADESGDTQCTWYNKGTGAVVGTRKVAGPNKRLIRTRFDEQGKATAEALTDGQRHVGIPLLSPDQKRILFSQGVDATDPNSRVFVVDISGDEPTPPVEVNGPIVSGGAIPDEAGNIKVRWAPNSKHAVYTAKAVASDKRDAFIVDVTQPGMAKRLHGDLPGPGSQVTEIAFSPDGAWVALLGDLESAAVGELFLVPITDGEPGEPRKANSALAVGEFVNALVWSPDGRYLAFSIEDELGLTRAYLVELGSGAVSTAIPIGDVGDDVSSLRFLSAGF
jgi:dipeptidyl aminopeptidase/acylaminoacyl peptidase